MSAHREPQPLRDQRELGDIVNDSLSFHFRQLGLFAVIVAPFVLYGIVTSLVTYLITDRAGLQFLISILTLPLDVLVYQLVAAAVVAVIKANEQERRISAGEALDIAQERASDVPQVALRLTLAALAIFTIIGTYWGIKRSIQWSLAIPALILDDLDWREALACSRSFVDGVWWQTFGRLLLCGLLLYVPALVIGALISAALAEPLGTIGASLPYLFSTSYPIIATALIYTDRQQRTQAALGS